MSVPLATATVGHLPRSPLGTATDGFLGFGSTPPPAPVEEPDEVLRDFGPWVPLTAPRRVRLEGRHIGANWATGEVFARVTASGGARQSHLAEGGARGVAHLCGFHAGRASLSAAPRSVSPRMLANRRRNERAVAILLTVIRNRQP